MMRRIAYITVLVFMVCWSATAQFLPYTVVNIDNATQNTQFSVDREYYGNTPFFKFVITDDGSAVDLSGWDFALKYGYSKDADVLYSFTGTNYVTVTNNQVLINGTTNYYFEPRDNYYIALQGTYTNGGANYKYTFAEGRMDVTYTPATDEEVQNLINGLTFSVIRINGTITNNNLIAYLDGEAVDSGISNYTLTNAVNTINGLSNTVALAGGAVQTNNAIYSNAVAQASVAYALSATAIQNSTSPTANINIYSSNGLALNSASIFTLYASTISLLKPGSVLDGGTLAYLRNFADPVDDNGIGDVGYLNTLYAPITNSNEYVHNDSTWMGVVNDATNTQSETWARYYLDNVYTVPNASFNGWEIPSTSIRSSAINPFYRLYSGGVDTNILVWCDFSGDANDLSSYQLGGGVVSPKTTAHPLDIFLANGYVWATNRVGSGNLTHYSEIQIPPSPSWQSLNGSGDILVSIRAACSQAGLTQIICETDLGQGGWEFDRASGNTRFIVDTSSGNNTAQYALDDTNIVHRYTGWWNSSTHKASLFVDGSLVHTSASAGGTIDLPVSTLPLTIGGQTGADNYGWVGSISSFVLYAGSTNNLSTIENLLYLDDAYHQVIGLGQSLARGNDSGSMISPVQPDCYMFSSLNLPSSGASLNSISYSMESPIIAASQTLMWPGRRMIVGSAAIGSTSYSGLKRGTTAYTNVVNQLTWGKAAAVAAGRDWSPDFVFVNHGESDHVGGTTKEQYKGYLKEWISNVDEDCKTLGAEVLPKMILSQFSSWTAYNDTTSPLAVGQWEASVEDDRIYMSGPQYIVEHPSSGVHPTNTGYQVIGEYMGKAANSVAMTGDWNPVQPIDAFLYGSNIVIHFDVPVSPLQLTTNLVSDPGNFGFEFYDSTTSAVISAVSVTAPNEVTVFLDTAPSGADKSVRYAYTGVSGNDAGPTTGARGCLHDSDPYPSKYTGEALNNYCVSFDWDL